MNGSRSAKIELRPEKWYLGAETLEKFWEFGEPAGSSGEPSLGIPGLDVLSVT